MASLSSSANDQLNMNISDLIANICYLFGVCGYTVNGFGLWTVIGNITLSKQEPTNTEL